MLSCPRACPGVCVCVIRAAVELAKITHARPHPPPPSRWTSGSGEQHTCCMLLQTLLHGHGICAQATAATARLDVCTPSPRQTRTQTFLHFQHAFCTEIKNIPHQALKTCTHDTRTRGSAGVKSTGGRDDGQAGLGPAHSPHALRTFFLPGTHQETVKTRAGLQAGRPCTMLSRGWGAQGR